jgi:hypothetical protein
MSFLNPKTGGYIVGTAGLITVATIIYMWYDSSSTFKESVRHPTAAWNAFTENSRAPSLLKQGSSSSVSNAVSDLVSETSAVFGSNSSGSKGGGSKRRCKKGGKRKTKGRK